MEHAIILGLIQGLTEFLPVSSSGHLILLPELLGWNPSGLAFDVALNTGTFLAVLIYFFPVWWGLLLKGLFQLQEKELRFLWLLILATIPAAVIGFFAEDIIESALRQPAVAACTLILFGLLLWWVEKNASLKKTIDDLNWQTALRIGFAQALALIPGVSRSGITMTAGLSAGLTKEEAAQFSFMLLAPISLGAAILQYSDVVNAPNRNEMAVGGFVAFLVGISAIHFLMKFIKKYGFGPYVWYRVVLGLLAIGVLLVR